VQPEQVQQVQQRQEPDEPELSDLVHGRVGRVIVRRVLDADGLEDAAVQDFRGEEVDALPDPGGEEHGEPERRQVRELEEVTHLGEVDGHVGNVVQQSRCE